MMHMHTHYPPTDPPDALLVKHLLGEGSAEENREAADWIAESEDHARYFSELTRTWAQTAGIRPVASPPEEEAWQRFRERVGARPSAPVRRFAWRRILEVAAAAVLIAGAAWVILFQLRPAHRTVTLASDSEVRTLTLPDGSRVTLNAGSRLSYRGNFGEKTRTVALEGEAFFDVAPARGKPFVAETRGLTVTVLGTRFNLNGKARETEVIVETGKVEVTSGKQAVFLGAHEKAIAKTGGVTLEKETVRGALYDYYRTGVFACQATPLGDLVNTLNEAYGAQVSLGDTGMSSWPLTTTFRQSQPLDSILAVISQTFGLTISREHDHIVLLPAN